VTGDRSERVWDADVLEEVNRRLLGSCFIPARPTINTDEVGTNVMGNAKPALFRSDRDMFSFFYSDRDPGDDGFGGLCKGVMVFNSEVGYKSFGFSTFDFREMCELPDLGRHGDQEPSGPSHRPGQARRPGVPRGSPSCRPAPTSMPTW